MPPTVDAARERAIKDVLAGGRAPIPRARAEEAGRKPDYQSAEGDVSNDERDADEREELTVELAQSFKPLR